MKKIILLLLMFLIISGCKNNISKENKEVEFSCKVNDNYILYCDDFTKIYNEYGDLVSLIPESGISENYDYEYYSDGKISVIRKEGMEEIHINYDENNNISKIDYIIDPSTPENLRTILTYNFYYNDKNVFKKIEKTFNNTNTVDIIDFEYNDDIIIESKVIGNKKYVRKYKNITKLNNKNIFEIVNFLPYIYIEKLKYIPYNSDFDLFYDYKQSPIYIPNLISFEIINMDINRTTSKFYYYDSNQKFIADSDFKIIHNYEMINKNSEICYTIYEKELYTNYYEYYLYETKYYYEDSEIISFTKYKEKQISKQEYEYLKKEYLKSILK